MSTQYPENTGIRMLFNNIVENATLLCVPSPYGTLPAENVLEVGSHRVMRTSSTAFTFTATWSETQTFNVAALDKHNFTSSATVTFSILEEDGGAVVGSYVLPSIENCLVWNMDVITPLEGKQLKIVVQDDTNPDSYLQVGRIGAGEALVPVHTVKPDASLGYADTGKQDRAYSGSLTIFPGHGYREINFSLDLVSREERDYISNFLTVSGIRSSFFVTVFPGWGGRVETDYQGFFHLDGKSPSIPMNFIDQFSLSFALSDSEIIA